MERTDESRPTLPKAVDGSVRVAERGLDFPAAPTLEQFPDIVASALSTHAPNARQREAISAQARIPLLIVAGPGTGKTTTLVLRALRFTFLDGVAPEQMLITTFTDKAGREIKSRLIEWGSRLRAHLLNRAEAAGDGSYVAHLGTVDVNRYITGTLDSICEDSVRDMREPNEAPPVILEQSAARAILNRKGEVRRELDTLGDPFRTYLGRYSFSGDPVRTNGEATDVIRPIVDRIIQDRVDLGAFAAGDHPNREYRHAILRIKERYESHLARTNQMDFTLLEQRFLDRLQVERLPRSMNELRMLLVDEYQDTNPLQEAIYFELVRRTGASLTVVGDDDQSLYRFRGATIELFRDFRERAVAELGCREPQLVCLEENYRSSEQIVSFFTNYVRNDPDFAPARVQLPAPYTRRVVSTVGPVPVGVIGMFRNDEAALASDLADFLHRLFRQGGRNPLPHEDTLLEPILPAHDGDVGDAVLLCSTVAEKARPYKGRPGRDRLPYHLRRELGQRGISVFNPRGLALRNIEIVRQFLGLILESLDPALDGNGRGPRQQQVRITGDAHWFLDEWRAAAATLLALNERSQRGEFLADKVARWRRLAVEGQDPESEWPILDICYSFLPWFQPFQDDPEAQVYLEAITRTVAAASTFSGYKASIQRDEPHRARSIKGAILDVLAPIAEDIVTVDEDIMPSVPRDRLNIMTIHQAKGLEFPLVIVDISSDFKKITIYSASVVFPRSLAQSCFLKMISPRSLR